MRTDRDRRTARRVIGGKDILAEAVTPAYTEARTRVRYLDDWRTHYVFGGEVHCGSDTIRAAGTRCWNSPTRTELTVHRRFK
ncbi:protein-arginine deiminase family protein [Streptomyces europaeiscabiei]|uniref:Protein-arginine deiminase family protein n=1 Tax=Streptomyces europaeiscabiei TaxID=146819 RepID=A0AAJ2PS42_9ACTN|nr:MULTISPECIES: protein-arginine deiminase family protein [Streptomyces]KFF98204.1 hypothetical protein IQ62_26415 [Streptomyces scabiei]MDX3132649.1 protein-arginine deiminase family protein [Streptomyces europaeiscabiei]